MTVNYEWVMSKRSHTYFPFLIFTILATAVLAVLSINSLFSSIYGQTTYGQNAGQNAGSNSNGPQASNALSSVQDLVIPDARGGFSSLQTDDSNKVWITTGKWNLISDPTKIGQSNLGTVGFNATIDMRGTDNLNEHEHKVSNFKLAQGSMHSTTQGSIFTFNGTATVKTPQGVYPQVPISIRLIDKSPISVAVDNQTQKLMPQLVPGGGTIILMIDKAAQDHFGNTPVYGNVKPQK